MAEKSAGILMYKKENSKLYFLLAHPGGPFFVRRDNGVWTIPKGKINLGEDPLDAAKREFKEETGIDPVGDTIELGEVKQKSGKIVYGWAIEGDFPKNFEFKSNSFEMEWPKHSKKMVKFQEIDRIQFFESDMAKEKIIEAQGEFIVRLEEILKN